MLRRRAHPVAVAGHSGGCLLCGAVGRTFLLGFFSGPDLFRYNLDIAGGIFIAYFVGNMAMIFMGIMIVPFFGSILKLPKAWLLPPVLLLSTMGTYSLQNSVFDLWVMLAFGCIGYLLRRAHYPLAPIIIGMILGPVLENNFRRALLIS